MFLPLMLWGLFLFTQIFIVAIGYVLALKDSDKTLASFPWAWPGQNGDIVGIVFLAFAVLNILFGYVFPKIVSKESAKGSANKSPAITPSTSRKAPVFYVLQLVTAESATILGLVFSILRQNPHLAVPFAAMGIFATLVYFPSDKHLSSISCPS